MKGQVLALGHHDGRKAAALLSEGRLQDLLTDPPAQHPRIGAVFHATFKRQADRLGGAFVGLPGDASGFLRSGGRGSGAVIPGTSALVQVTGFAEPGKAVPVSKKISLRGRYLVLTPGAPGVNISRKIADPARRAALAKLMAEDCPGILGAILRSSCAHAPDPEILAEAQALHQQALDLDAHAAPALVHPGPDAHERAQMDWPDAALASFADFEVAEMIAEMLQPQVPLTGGASAYVEVTRALVAIDVNTGGDLSPAAGLKANLALARDLPRQLRCRGLGGQVVIDAAPLPKKDRPMFERALADSFRKDGARADLVGWTGLGHFELKAARIRAPL